MDYSLSGLRVNTSVLTSASLMPLIFHLHSTVTENHLADTEQVIFRDVFVLRGHKPEPDPLQVQDLNWLP